MFFFVLSGIVGYLIGSIPTAFLLVRWKSNVDIRGKGSGNVGALNSFEVTRSKWVGGAVLVADALKGMFAVWIASSVFGGQFSTQAVAGVAVVAGHNFPVWLGFRGGRGLATAAGVTFVIAWPALALWCALWVLGFLLIRHINVANALASVVELIGILVAPGYLLSLITGTSIETGEFRIFGLALFIVILIKHVEPVREFFVNSRVRNQE